MKILFIDDEQRRMKSYVEELEDSGYEVEFESEVDSALKNFENNRNKFDLIILDIMMPTGNSFNSTQTENGLRTGICFYNRIRKSKPFIPIIIFTNVSVYDRKTLQDMNDDSITVFCEKDSFIPVELAEKVKNMLSK